MNTITGGNGPSCSGCVTNVGIRPALVGISTMRSFIALYLVPSRSMLELAEQRSQTTFQCASDTRLRPYRAKNEWPSRFRRRHVLLASDLGARGARCAPNAP